MCSDMSCLLCISGVTPLVGMSTSPYEYCYTTGWYVYYAY